MSRGSKRIIIISIYLFLLFAAGMFLYFIFKPDPTCFDRKQNQGEDNIDCGGPCQACIIPISADDLEIKNYEFIVGGPDKYDVLVEIHNPNDQFGSPEFSYKLALKSSSEEVLAESSGKSYILPSETKHIIEANLETRVAPSRVEFEISDVKWVEFWDYDRPRLNIYKKQYSLISSGTGFSEVSGLLRNESPFDFHVINMNIILKSTEKKTLAVNKMEIRDINSKEERDFKIFWPNSFPGEVQEIIVEAKTNVFDSQNFIDQYFPGGKFQEYQ